MLPTNNTCMTRKAKHLIETMGFRGVQQIDILCWLQ